MSQANVVLITKESTMATVLKSVLNENRRVRLAGICKGVSQLRSYLSNIETQIHAVVVDIDPDPSRVLYDLGVILSARPEIRVVVICSSFTKELILQAMQVGARHFLQKKTAASELLKVLEQLTPDGGKKRDRVGSIISVFSVGGGCGATTVALNLASELQLLSSEPVLAIDLDGFYGTVSAYLGITTQYGIADVLAHKGPIDKHLITSSVYKYTGDFHVLASPAGIESPRSKWLQYENLFSALEACRQVYGYSVIDAPRIPESIVTNLANLSDAVLVVFQLTVKDVKFARSMVSALTKSGIAHEKIIPLVNRFKKRSHLVRLEDGKKALGTGSLYRIRSHWRDAMNCVSRGRLLTQVAPRSRLRSDFRGLAAKIHACGANGDSKV
jgi:pilus assembly protein CpaE